MSIRNDGGNSNNWLGISLKGGDGPTGAIAAKVVVTSGGKKQVFVNQWATSYLSNSDPRIHVGLGKNGSAEMIEVTWNNGKKEVIKNVPCNRYITILQGKGIQ
jgi:hypothetical protein